MQQTTQPDARGVRLRFDKFGEYCYARRLHSTKAQADFIGMHPATVYRIVRGDDRPGTTFIAATCLAFGVSIDDLYEPVADVAAAAAA